MEFTVGGNTDYDTDNDRLIDIDSAAKLNAVRWDLNGDGEVDAAANQAGYTSAFADAMSGMGCPSAGCIGYELTADVDLAGYSNWTPIGDRTNAYTAVFEGNGRTVANLTIDSSADYLGLFASLGSTAAVRNLRLVDARIAVTVPTGRQMAITDRCSGRREQGFGGGRAHQRDGDL